MNRLAVVEIEAAEALLLHELATRKDRRLRLTVAMRAARRAGLKGVALVEAMRRHGVTATRDKTGKWGWTLPAKLTARGSP